MAEKLMANNLSQSIPRCPKHPDLQQLPGVCSSCLRERLYELFVSSNNYACRFSWNSPSNSSSLFSSYSANSSSFSNYASSSPPQATARRKAVHRRNGSAADAVSSVLLTVSLGNGGSGGGGLKKSRSIAFVTRNRSSGGEVLKKRGFWSRLIHFKGKNAARQGVL